MDVADFVKEFSRMCDEYNTCRGCPMDGKCNPCTEAVYKDPQGVVEIVEKWSKEHPVTNGEIIMGFKDFPRCDNMLNAYDGNILIPMSWWDAPYKAPKEE